MRVVNHAGATHLTKKAKDENGYKFDAFKMTV